MNLKKVFILIFVFLSGIFVCSPASAQEFFLDYCLNSFLREDICPPKICEMKCSADQAANPDCFIGCLPRECPKIKAEDCPADYCAIMTDCSKKKICHYKMAGEQPACGNLAYAGQDVDCCKGFQRRCGVEFLEGYCDMEGKNSIYNIPICIPCGDGICAQFEDRCNCPEDCLRETPKKVDRKTLKNKLKDKDKEDKADEEDGPESTVEKETRPRIIEITPAQPKKGKSQRR